MFPSLACSFPMGFSLWLVFPRVLPNSLCILDSRMTTRPVAQWCSRSHERVRFAFFEAACVGVKSLRVIKSLTNTTKLEDENPNKNALSYFSAENHQQISQIYAGQKPSTHRTVNSLKSQKHRNRKGKKPHKQKGWTARAGQTMHASWTFARKESSGNLEDNWA